MHPPRKTARGETKSVSTALREAIENETPEHRAAVAKIVDEARHVAVFPPLPRRVVDLGAISFELPEGAVGCSIWSGGGLVAKVKF